jgi:hypothetical protein
LKNLNYIFYKSIQKYDVTALNILIDVIDLKLDIKKIVILKLLNDLSTFFSQYMMIINELARINEKLSNLKNSIKHLKDEELRIKNVDQTINFVARNQITLTSKKNKKNESKKNKKSSKKYTCRICKVKKHWLNKYSQFDLDYRKNKKNTNKSSNQKLNITCVLIKNDTLIKNAMINHLEEYIKSTILIVDFEIPDHAICNNSMLIDYKKVSSFINIDLSQRLIVFDRDILIIHLECDEKMNILILINVLFVSDLKINLISIIKLARSEVEFWMQVDKLTKIYYRDNLIDQVLIKRSQYIIRITENRDITALILIDEKSARLW